MAQAAQPGRGQSTAPKSLKQVDADGLLAIRQRCEKLIRKRATLSAAVTLVPLPGIDAAVDVVTLSRTMDAISEAYGLTPAQIEAMAPKEQAVVYGLIKSVGSSTVGRKITQKIVLMVLKKVAGRFASKQVLKYIPLAGQITASALSASAMWWVCKQHLDACHAVAQGKLKGGLEAGRV